MNIHGVDCHYVQAEFANAWILESSSEWALVDPTTEKGAHYIEAEILRLGLQPENMKYIVITHVHLDHAAATGYWSARFPKARVLASSRSERHLVNPSKLVRSAQLVYGADAFRDLYGEVTAVPAERIQAQSTGSTVTLGDETLEFHETRGHAKHHVCIFAKKTRALFSGDMCGVRYPALQTHGLFVIPSTSPTDFNGSDALESLARLESLGPTAIYPTHFGKVIAVAGTFHELRAHYEFTLKVCDEMNQVLDHDPKISDSDLIDKVHARWDQHVSDWASERGFQWTAEQWQLLNLDLQLNAQGVAWTILSSRSPKSPE